MPPCPLSNPSRPAQDQPLPHPRTRRSHATTSRTSPHLARLDLTETELDTFLGQLSVILDSVASVAAVAAVDIEPTSHAVPLVNVYRDDVIVPGLTREAALAGAPAQEQDRFRVPQILGEEQ